jgi:hypothetical protein
VRLTDDQIDRALGVIKPEGGRKKTGVEQVSPLTTRGREILDEIKKEKPTAGAVSNLKGLIFTREDGTPVTKGMIEYQVERALKETKIKKFVFS